MKTGLAESKSVTTKTKATMTEKEARAFLLMPGPEPCCEWAPSFKKFRYNRDGRVTAAEFRCKNGHVTLWTPDDERRREEALEWRDAAGISLWVRDHLDYHSEAGA